MLEIGLKTFLSANVASVGERVYPQMIPEHVYNDATKHPCLVYQRSSSPRIVKTCGTDELVKASIQIDVYSPKYLLTKQVAQELYEALQDYRGNMGSVQVGPCHQESDLDLLDATPGLHRVSQSWAIWYLET